MPGQKTAISASECIQLLAHLNSSNVYLYDLAAQLGLGDILKRDANGRASNVIEMETREGAGLALLGWINGQSSSMESSVITAFTTPQGLALMAPSISSIQKVTNSSIRLVIQVPNISTSADTLSYNPSLSALTNVLPFIPDHVAVIVSSSAEEAIDLAKLSYSCEDKHVIHIFDQYAFARENKHFEIPNGKLEELQPFDQQLKSLQYEYFSYAGPVDSESVVVIMNGPLASFAESLILSTGRKLGLIKVRVVKPWNAEALQAALPTSVKKLYVMDDVNDELTNSGYLHGQIFTSLFESGITIESIKLTPSSLQSFISDSSRFEELLDSFGTSVSVSPSSTSSKKLLFYGSSTSPLNELPNFIQSIFANSKTVKARIHSEYDIFSKPGGTALHRVLLSAATASPEDSSILPFLIPLDSNAGQADFIAISDQTLLKTHHVLKAAKKGSLVLLFTNWLPNELSTNLPGSVIKHIVENGLKVHILDTKAIANDVDDSRKTLIEQCVAQMAFLRLYLGGRSTQKLVETLTEVVFGSALRGIYSTLSKKLWAILREVSLSEVVPDETEAPLQFFEFNTVSPPKSDVFKEEVASASLGTWMDAAKYYLFREAFTLPEDGAALRPDIPEDHYLVSCTVNRRLTPLSYERNVFHLEFDTSGTGLKYAIGEALGVHGWNDADDVLHFCEWYGIDPHATVKIPVPESGGKKFHRRTVFQALQQQIDIFGQPPKSFYSSLAEYTTKREDRMTLLFIAAPEGASMFKKLAEKDTVTFADILERFKSARPSVEVLAELVGDIKPRHYSIASAQSAVGDQVDLLVVTVDWVTPSGSPRYGQCTRYLAGMKPGQKVTVSIKPSVMKLPPDDMQPIIMAGLGTGAAPFRAFMQHRALLASKKIASGPLIYYFGSRHRSEEYLYGEEIEAYLASSVITHAGLAFSRDQKEKVYIQHKMKMDGDMLIQMLRRDKGVFYLCGPTWPVPDVYETLLTSLMKMEGGDDAVTAAGYFETLKEEERYVLEVY